VYAAVSRSLPARPEVRACVSVPTHRSYDAHPQPRKAAWAIDGRRGVATAPAPSPRPFRIPLTRADVVIGRRASGASVRQQQPKLSSGAIGRRRRPPSSPPWAPGATRARGGGRGRRSGVVRRQTLRAESRDGGRGSARTVQPSIHDRSYTAADASMPQIEAPPPRRLRGAATAAEAAATSGHGCAKQSNVLASTLQPRAKEQQTRRDARCIRKRQLLQQISSLETNAAPVPTQLGLTRAPLWTHDSQVSAVDTVTCGSLKKQTSAGCSR